MNNYERDYKNLLVDLILLGDCIETRTGIVTRLFNKSIKVDSTDGFPMLTGRKMYFNTVQAEAEWMLSGSTNIKDLHKSGVHIWDQWANSDGELGPTYGAQLARQWDHVMKSIVDAPNSRRHVIDLWDADNIDAMALPPCYFAMQFYFDNGRLCMTATSRSSDAAVGLPYDIAVLAYLLHKACNITGSSIGYVLLNVVDMHINEENLMAVKLYINRHTYDLPCLYFTEGKACIDSYVFEDPIKMIVKP